MRLLDCPECNFEKSVKFVPKTSNEPAYFECGFCGWFTIVSDYFKPKSREGRRRIKLAKKNIGEKV